MIQNENSADPIQDAAVVGSVTYYLHNVRHSVINALFSGVLGTPTLLAVVALPTILYDSGACQAILS